MGNPTPIVEGFSIKHAQICDGLATFKATLAASVSQGLDIYGVNNGSLAADVGNYENQGDDQTQSRWNWINFATLAIQSGYLSIPLASTMTGRPMTTVMSTDTVPVPIAYETDLWHEDSVNVDPKPVMLVCPSRDHLRKNRQLIIGLYSVSFGPIGFDGPAYKDGLKVNYEGTALMSSVDETGTPFSDGKNRIGRILSVV